MTTMTAYDSPASLKQLLEANGLNGLEAIHKARIKHAMNRVAADRGNALIVGLQGLDGVDSLEELAELAELAGLGKKLKKALAKVARVIPVAALIAPSKTVLKAAKKGLKEQALMGAAAGAAILAPAAAPLIAKVATGVAVQKIQQKIVGKQAPIPQVQEAPVYSEPQSYSEPQGQSFAAGGSDQPLTGQYYAAGEPDPSQAQAQEPRQWISGIDNKWVALGGGSFALLLVALLAKRGEK